VVRFKQNLLLHRSIGGSWNGKISQLNTFDVRDLEMWFSVEVAISRCPHDPDQFSRRIIGDVEAAEIQPRLHERR
jgi:hypothetical protein